jgi:hypothetical protein
MSASDLLAVPGWLLGFFGFQLGSAAKLSPAELVAGRWRSSILLAFLVWTLMTASEADEAWVAGAVTFDYTPGNEGRRLASGGGEAALRSITRALGGAAPAGALGATRLQASFLFGLDSFLLRTEFVFESSQEVTLATIVLDLMAFIRNAVAGAAAGTEAEFLELSKIDTRKIADVHGLVTAAIVFQSFSLAALIICAWKVPVWFRQHMPAISCASAAMGAFMQFCAICTFAASGLEKAFCDALDPTPDVVKLPCGYGDAYNAGAVAVVLSMLWVAACWRWVPWTESAGDELLGGSIGGGGGEGSKAADAAAEPTTSGMQLGGGYQSL